MRSSLSLLALLALLLVAAGPAAVAPDATVTGTVVDPSGAPLAGVTVRSDRIRPGGLLRARLVPGPEATTDAEGRFALSLPPGAIVNVRADAGEAGRAFATCVSPGTDLRLVAGRGPRIRVKVTDPDGKPVADANVLVFLGPGHRLALPVARGRTDGGGEFRAGPYSPGPALVMAFSARLGSAPERRLDLTVEGTAELEFVLGEGPTVRGRVLDGASGEPISGARVGESPFFLRSVTTAAEGAFSLPGCGLRGGAVVFAEADGYATAEAEGGEGPVEIRLERGFRYEGRVVSAEGEPVGGARVLVYGDSHGLTFRTVRTSADGRFRTGPLARGSDTFFFQAGAEGHGTVVAMYAPAAGESDVGDLGDVALPPAAVISGTVRGADGRPRAGVGVVLERGGADADPDPRGDRYRRTNDAGRFLFPDLGPGIYRVSLVDGDAATTVRVSRGGRATADLTMAANAPGTLTVRVLEPDGQPVAGAWVRAPGETLGFTGPDGRVRLRDLPGKEVDLSVDRPMVPGLPFEQIWAGPFPADGREVEVRFPDRPLLCGRVLDPAGGPVPFLSVQAMSPAGEPVAGATTDREGRFALRLPGADPVGLWVDGTRWATKPGESPEVVPYAGHLDGVRPGDEPTIRTVKVARDRTLVVRVLSPDGEPLAHASIGAVGWAGRRYSFVEEDGRGRIQGLPDRELTVTSGAFRVPEGEPWVSPAPAHVVPEGQEVVLEVRRGVWIHGVVVDEAGEPVAGAGIGIRGLSRAIADGQGRFRIAALPGEPATLDAGRQPGRDARPLEGTLPDVVPGVDDEVKVVVRPAR